MKEKITIIFCTVILMLTLTSCNKYKQQVGEFESGNIFADYQYNQEEVQSKYGTSEMAIAENGYYYIIDNILFFYNVNSDVNMPVCSKVNCKHSDENCDAYVSSVKSETGSFACNCLGNKIFFYNNHLYCIEVTKDRDYDLYQYDASFGNKKKILRLASVKEDKLFVSDAKVCMISEGYLYYYTSYLDPEYANNDYITKFQCNRIKLEENAAREELGEFDFPGDYAAKAGDSNGLAIYLSDNNIYFYAGGTARMYSKDNRVQYRVAKYNPAEKQFDIIWTHTGNDSSDVLGKDTGNVNYMSGGNFVKMDSDGNFYILNATEENVDRIIKVNFEDNISEVLYTTQQDRIYSLQSDGENLYFFESSSGRNTKSYFISTDFAGTIKSKYEMLYDDIYLSKMEEHYKMYPDDNAVKPDASHIIVYGIDDRYILMGCEEPANVFKGLKSSETSDKLDKISGVGVLNTKDYLDGSDVTIKQIYQYEQ